MGELQNAGNTSPVTPVLSVQRSIDMSTGEQGYTIAELREEQRKDIEAVAERWRLLKRSP